MINDNSVRLDIGIASSDCDVKIVQAKLHDATLGLRFTSESDYDMTIFQFPSPPLTTATTTTTIKTTTKNVGVENAASILLSITDMPTNIDVIHRQDWTTGTISVEETSLDWFFHRYTIVQDWWESSQHSELQRWKHLECIINTFLFDVKVFRIGQASDYGLFGSIDIFILGHCRSDPHTWMGLHTVSVET